MTSFTQDKWLNFVIDNYDEIKSLLEVWEHSKTGLLDQINTTIIDCIEELKSEYFDNANMKLKIEDDCCYWYHQNRYDIDTDTGLFFEFDLVSGKRTIEYDLLGDSFYYFFAFNPEGKTQKGRRSENDRIKNIFEQNKNELQNKGIIITLEDGEQFKTMYIAEYYLTGLNIKALKSPEKFRSDIKESVKYFTDTINEFLLKNNL
jgi:phage portal protein BeeE